MYELSDETKKHLSEIIGIPYEQLIQMDNEEITAYIEQKNGKKLTYSKPRITGSGDDSVLLDRERLITMEDVDKRLDKITRPSIFERLKNFLTQKKVNSINNNEYTIEK